MTIWSMPSLERWKSCQATQTIPPPPFYRAQKFNLPSLSVTVCTTSLNIQKFYILPTEYFYVFVRDSGKTSKVSLYNRQRPDFVTVEASVYCAVRPGPLNTIDYASSVNGYLRHLSTFIKRNHQGNTKYLQKEWPCKTQYIFSSGDSVLSLTKLSHRESRSK